MEEHRIFHAVLDRSVVLGGSSVGCRGKKRRRFWGTFGLEKQEVAGRILGRKVSGRVAWLGSGKEGREWRVERGDGKNVGGWRMACEKKRRVFVDAVPRRHIAVKRRCR